MGLNQGHYSSPASQPFMSAKLDCGGILPQVLSADLLRPHRPYDKEGINFHYQWWICDIGDTVNCEEIFQV